MQNRGYKFLVALLILLAIAMNYTYFDGFVIKNLANEEVVSVERVIDGDTVVDTDGIHYRLLGINTPEKGEKYYEEAKDYAEILFMNKSIIIDRRGKDLYDRELAYFFYNGENLNQKIVRAGYANYYFPEGRDIYYNDITQAWKDCIKDNKNLCKTSTEKCAGCILAETMQFEFDKDLILYNSCDFKCNTTGWSIKDEGRKKFIFNNSMLKSKSEVTITTADFGETYVWTKTGDTMFLRDKNGDLILWAGY